MPLLRAPKKIQLYGKDSKWLGTRAQLGASFSQWTIVGWNISGSSSDPPATLATLITLAAPISISAQSLLPQTPQKLRVFVLPDFAVTLNLDGCP